MASRIKKSFINIPASLKEALGFITEIGRCQREINKLKREAKAEVVKINADLETKVEALTKERDTFFTAFFAFAGPKKDELLTGKARSVKTPAGQFGWRWTPPAVVLKKGVTEAQVIAFLEKAELSEYVRVTKELNREALLQARLEIPHLSYENQEEFFAKPKLLQTEGRAEELSTVAIDK